MGEAELAGGQVDFTIVAVCAQGWAEGPADDGTGFVEVAGSTGGVEDRAGLVVAEAVFGFVGEEWGVFEVFVEDAGLEVAGEVGGEAGAGGGSSGLDAVGFFGVDLFQGGEGFAETGGVLRGDWEDSDAALAAAGVTGEVVASALIGVGYGGVYDLDEEICHCALRVFSITSTASRTEMV